MKTVKILLVVMVLVFWVNLECEADEKPFPAGKSTAFFVKAYRTGRPIKIEEGVNLYVIGCQTPDQGKSYEFAFNFIADPEPDGTLPKIKGMSLYLFSAQPESMVQISYENANQWAYLSAYQPATADYIIDEHGGPDSFYGLSYAWLVGVCLMEVSNDLGVIFLKTPAKNRLKFVIETYILVE